MGAAERRLRCLATAMEKIAQGQRSVVVLTVVILLTKHTPSVATEEGEGRQAGQGMGR
jgi:hypothetical protein